MTVADLTVRERRVLQLLSTGKTNKQIGVDMFVCEKTVEHHLGKLYSKTGARTHVGVVVWAMQQGLNIDKFGVPLVDFRELRGIGCDPIIDTARCRNDRWLLFSAGISRKE